MKNLKAIILAAGEGSRMKSKKPKVLHEILNKKMIDYVIDSAKDCGAQEVCVVVGHKAQEVKTAIAKEGVSFALQEEQKGTGHDGKGFYREGAGYADSLWRHTFNSRRNFGKISEDPQRRSFWCDCGFCSCGKS